MNLDFSKSIRTTHTKPCPTCKGTGTGSTFGGAYPRCETCRGSGTVPDPKPVELHLDLYNGRVVNLPESDGESFYYVCQEDGTVPGESWRVENAPLTSSAQAESESGTLASNVAPSVERGIITASRSDMTLEEILTEDGFCGDEQPPVFRFDDEVGCFVSKWGGVISQGGTRIEALAAVVSARIMMLKAKAQRVENVPEEGKVEPLTDGMSDREKLIRYGFSFDSDRDCDAARYLMGVIDTLRWDRKLLRDREAEREAKPAPEAEKAEPHKGGDYHYSGDGSKQFWSRVNALSDKEVAAVCQLGCDLQAMEEKALKALYAAEMATPAPEEPKKRYRQGAGNPVEVIDNENSIWIAKCHRAIDAERIVLALNQMEERGS